MITNAQAFVVTATALALTLVLANLSWFLLERPLIRRGQEYRYAPTT